MALIRWEPVAELNTIQNEMNRLFNTLFDQPAPAGRSGTPARRWVPAMDLVETADHYVLRADLPGLSDDDVNIQFEDNVLTISGERKTQHEQHEEGYYRIERAFGSFARSLTLPDGVDPDAVRAHFDRGVLEIRIPKPEQKKPRHVQITLAANPKTIESADTTDSQANSGDPVPAPA
jgi:HSP20 family protein